MYLGEGDTIQPRTENVTWEVGGTLGSLYLMLLVLTLKLERADFHNLDNCNKQEMNWISSCSYRCRGICGLDESAPKPIHVLLGGLVP